MLLFMNDTHKHRIDQFNNEYSNPLKSSITNYYIN